MLREPFDLDAPHRHLLRLGSHAQGPYVLTRRFGVSTYDFEFETRLDCSHPIYLPDEARCIARVGLIADYAEVYTRLADQGLVLINSPEQSQRANDLSVWAPRLGTLTPKSLVFQGDVDVGRVEEELGYPLFVKTVQQTLGHRRDLAFVDDRASLLRSIAAYRSASTLAGQALAIRQRVPLRLVPDVIPEGRVPTALEVRVFVLEGVIVGLGAYWSGVAMPLTEALEAPIRALALEAYARLEVPFLAVDIAQHEDGSWLVIETNDAQESGYAQIDAEGLWHKVIAHYGGASSR